jgi:hypothetical protein
MIKIVIIHSLHASDSPVSRKSEAPYSTRLVQAANPEAAVAAAVAMTRPGDDLREE